MSSTAVSFQLLLLSVPSVLFVLASNSDVMTPGNMLKYNERCIGKDCHVKVNTSPADYNLTRLDCDVDMDDYIYPANFNVTEVKQEVVNGNGFYILRNVFSEKDVETAKQRVEYLTKHNRIQTNVDNSKSAGHNSYGGKRSGIVWRLLGKGLIFEKIARHPVLINITREILGPKSQISSFMSNSVAPGMKGQTPHIDYPYYDGFFPTSEQNIPRPLLSIGIMIMLSDFTKESGGTGVRPGSQRNPTYPHDQDEFFKNMVQMEGKPGDVGVFAASLQHCAMPNKSPNFRIGIVQSMIPVYLKPYQDISIGPQQAHITQELRTLLALDHPYPMAH